MHPQQTRARLQKKDPIVEVFFCTSNAFTTDMFHLAEPPGIHLRQPGAAARAELDGAGAGGRQLGAAPPDGPGAARGGAQVVLPQHRRRRLPRHLRAHAARRRPKWR